MLNRRLIILFIAFFACFCALGTRLAYLQFVKRDEFRQTVQAFSHRVEPIETYRGSIVDRNGRLLAQDVPSDELAIDYRAMNLDDSWLDATARARLQASGEWDALPNRAAKLRRREEVKEELVTRIEAIPDAIAQACGIPREEVLDRFQEIRGRIHALRQDMWTLRQFSRSGGGEAAATQSTSRIGRWWDSLWNKTDAGDDDAALDADFQGLQLKDEVIAHTIRSNIPLAVANYFRQHSADFPGLIVRDKANRRDYPFGESMAQIIGTMRSVDSQTLIGSAFKYPSFGNPAPTTKAAAKSADGNLGGYLPGDRMGESGAEKLLESSLRGARGVQLIDGPQDDDGAVKDPQRVDPLPGRTVKMTIDAALQNDLYEDVRDPGLGLSKGQDGKDHFVAIVVLSMDGQVLALVSNPSYDPNQIDETRTALSKDQWRNPLLSRAFRQTYPPGSTIKPLLASAALTESLITPEETVTCTGHFYPTRTDIFRCLEVHGTVALVEAIAQSCNIYFYTVGQRMGIERLSHWYGLYGFGHETGMELSEAPGHSPNFTAIDADSARADALFLGIGQGPIDVTPLQMANAYATLLRGGTAIAPRILADTPTRKTEAFHLSPATLRVVHEGMEHVVSEGTGRNAFRGFHLAIAGKTGTAEKWRPVFDDNGNPVEDSAKPLLNPDNTPALKADGTPAFRQLTAEGTDAWFVGYAPADNPKFIVAAVMEWGGLGAAHAAPLVKQTFIQLERHDYLPHTDIP